jgi:hypothetical protein
MIHLCCIKSGTCRNRIQVLIRAKGTKILQSVYAKGTKILQSVYAKGTKILQSVYAKGTKILQSVYAKLYFMRQNQVKGTTLAEFELSPFDLLWSLN